VEIFKEHEIHLYNDMFFGYFGFITVTTEFNFAISFTSEYLRTWIIPVPQKIGDVVMSGSVMDSMSS
jgi:hypothetical protein